MNYPIKDLHRLGQSLWYDNIQRRMLENGDLARLIELGDLRGMTSNPSIFNQAIARSTDYDAALNAMAWAGFSAVDILDQLVIEDIRTAADLFLPLYQDTEGGDGYVSVEVSPDLAHDTEGTLAEARRLWDAIERPNLMIKIPATQAGLPAVRSAIAAGMNVNITLIFSIQRYQEVMEAYLAGLEERVASGKPVDRIASVASFFISRIDSKTDKQLDALIRREGSDAALAASLRGGLAVANARKAYALFRQVFASERFERLKTHRARLQRPLWASTSTKDPAYPDTKYVDDLIGPDTVNTVPPQTLDAFREQGTARVTVEDDPQGTQQVFDGLEKLGISVDQITRELEEEGVRAFVDAFADLLKTVESRRQAALAQLGPLAEAVAQRVQQLSQADTVQRIWSLDPSVWTQDEAGQREIRMRLGWLDLPSQGVLLIEDLAAFASEIQRAGFTHALLLGMGGSSLAPEVMSLIFSEKGLAGHAAGGLDLAILDSTDPAQVLSAARRSPVERTLYIVSSKSGGTAEVNAFLDYFWAAAQAQAGERAGQNFIAITDPGTSLEKLAKERSFRRVFMADPTVGGRYSALTVFGLVPAALMGVNLSRLLERAVRMEAQCRPEVPAGRNPGLVLGAVLGEAARQGMDKLTLAPDSALASFGSWLEQLIAESSGKEGQGIIPVDGEPLGEASIYGKDRLFVHLQMVGSPAAGGSVPGELEKRLEALRGAGLPVLTLTLEDPYDLGAEFYRWCFATGVACAVLGVNAFDQPDVQDNKTRTVANVDAYRTHGRLDEGQVLWEGQGVRLYGALPEAGAARLADFLAAFLKQGQPGDYVALNAYLPREAKTEELLEELRLAVRARTGLATTVGFGPRFLHSTGQLHKGGPAQALFLQITADPAEDVEIPGQGMTFATLERAQALGDLQALQARQRRALRVHLNQLDDLKLIIEAVKPV